MHDNKADFGGVMMITSESSVTIKDSIFSEKNTAKIYGGVMITYYRDSLDRSVSAVQLIPTTPLVIVME